MSQIIDRRLNGRNKSAVNRTRFIRRFKSQIKKAVSDAVARRGVTEIDQGGKVNIPARDISEPIFGHGPGGRRSIVHTGNREFIAGDQIPRPPKGQGGAGGKASNTGEGEDDFIFEISREEFLEFFFDDLALPNLVKTQLNAISEFTRVRAGFTQTGSPSDLNVIRSLRGAMGRRIALRSPYLNELEALEQELEELEDEECKKAVELKEQIHRVKHKILSIPFLDSFDLRFNSRIKIPKPATQAVMFCLMDVSGSMDQMKKDLAKRFFMLLYLFLKRSYEKIEVVFIRHHTIASEVGEEEFFYARETGGTVVSSALKLMRDVIRARFPTADWNIYAAQASDGDNWDDDSPLCEDLLITSIMPCLQYFAYIEIASEEEQNLWRRYLNVHSAYKNFAMQRILGVDDIFPVFRELFKRQMA
ncbi:MAG TPA: YeaH/YhbH family protein [Burkholderiales bacterium]|nr:YeaH/YhbH family protein [Burkholderiales bacterium]